jgi:hypothetical protein
MAPESVDPISHDPVGEPEQVASGIHALDDFVIDENVDVAYLTTHIEQHHRARAAGSGDQRSHAQHHRGRALHPRVRRTVQHGLGRGDGDYGHIAYVATDDGETLQPRTGSCAPRMCCGSNSTLTPTAKTLGNKTGEVRCHTGSFAGPGRVVSARVERAEAYALRWSGHAPVSVEYRWTVALGRYRTRDHRGAHQLGR